MCVTLSSQDTEVCSFCRGPQPPLLLTNPGHLLHPLHTSLVCSALTFLPDISSHLVTGSHPSLGIPHCSHFPTSLFPHPSTTVKISSLPSRLAVTASCPGRKAQVGCCPEERLVSTSRSLSCHHTTAARRPALDGTEDHSIPAQ